MKQESLAFTSADVPRFFDEILMEEVKYTIARLRAADERLNRLAPLIADERSGSEDEAEWTAKEVLAHLAVVARAYGVFAYLIAKGRLTELEFGNVISQRDVVGEEMAQRPVAEIVDEILGQHARTIAFLESATADDMKRTVKTENGEISVDHVIRIPLVAHGDVHLDQLEAALKVGQPALQA